jgi:hypothetical protein
LKPRRRNKTTNRCPFVFFILGSLFVAACSSDGGDGITFEDFQAEVRLEAGAGAADCGHVAFGADRSSANCCVATNFVQFLPFSATYDEQGIDSRVARGIALNASGTTTIFHFDSDPTGGNQQNNGVINRQTCDTPTLSQNPCSDPVGFPISCE